MNAKTLMLIFFVGITFAFIHCQAPAEMVEANDAEKGLCEEGVSNGTTLEHAKKNRTLACRVLCQYSDGSNTTINSPEDQSCSLMTQVVKSGTCKEGKCAVLGFLTI